MPESTADPIRFLALGDSYTIGESVAEEDRWPNQLQQELENSDQPIGEVKIVATTGWTTDELEEGIDAVTLEPPYDLVSLLIGVNDQYRGFDVAAYRSKLVRLVDRSIQLAGEDTSRVFLVSIPDYAYTPFGGGSSQISAGVDAYNAVMAQVANEFGLPYVYITPISRIGLQEPALVAEDDLHPSGLQYKRWVEEEIKGAVLALLS